MGEMSFQKKPLGEREDIAQRKGGAVLTDNRAVLRKTNKTGLPDGLKAGVENLSGMSMDHVRVHYNSAQPAQLNAHAYAQGSDIHLGPGQEKHLPHEAWHVVQQMQGRVRPTMQMKAGVGVNDDVGLERESDLMGGKALQRVLERQNVRPVSATEQQQSRFENSVERSSSNTCQLMEIQQIVQLSKGSFRRQEKNKRKAKAKEDQRLDPHGPKMTEGANEEYAHNKLEESENKGGHPRKRHVAMSLADLQNRKLQIATTFEDEAGQDKALNQIIGANKKKFQDWFDEPDCGERLELTGELSGVKVRGVERQDTNPDNYWYKSLDERDLVKLTVVFAKYGEPAKKRGETPLKMWRVVTCYPSR